MLRSISFRRWKRKRRNSVMQWFFLDTHQRGRSVYGWISASAPRLQTHRGRLHILLSGLSRFAPSSAFIACDGICVVAGPGPFSSIRSGVLLANLLARIYRLPLIAISAEEGASPRNLYPLLISRFKSTASYIAPEYDREPNITVKVPSA